VDYLQGSSEKAYKHLGWKPKVSFEVSVLCYTIHMYIVAC